MKEIYVLRHSTWDHKVDQLTEEGKQRCARLKSILPKFDIVIASKYTRSQETASLLTGSVPKIDWRVSSFEPTPEETNLIREIKQKHNLSFGYAVFRIPSLIPKTREEGEILIALLKETLSNLPKEGKALIIAHQDALLASDKLLTDSDFSTLTKDYKELEGFIVDENLNTEDFRPRV